MALPDVSIGSSGHVAHHDLLHSTYNRDVMVHSVGNSGTSLTITANDSGTTKLITLNGNCTFTLAGATNGELCSLELTLTQDGTGSRVVTWPGSVKWPSGTAPTLSTAAGAIDRVVLSTYNGGTAWYGDLVGKGYA